MSKDRVEQQIGERLAFDRLGVKVPHKAGKLFEVKLGSSCTQCDFAGLGHVVCPLIACTMHDRKDGHGIVYQEVMSEEEEK